MKPSKEQIQNQLWMRGELSWLCHSGQKKMREIFHKSEDNSTHVWLISRQFGKSTALAILALETALTKPNQVVKILTDTKLHAKNIFEPIFNELLATCPQEIKPTFYKNEYKYEFHNKSQIQLAGSDNGHYERLRGQRSNLVLVDEAGFCKDLDYVVKSILLPTTTHTGGKIILSSTPPNEEIHDFYNFIEDAEKTNTLVTFTIDDNPLLSDEQKKSLEKKMGGRDSNQFRREYLCHLVRSETNLVFPEFNDELIKEIVKEWPTPPFYDCYVAMDLGYQDLTGVLFGYFDFRANKVIVQDEIAIPGKNFKLPDLTKNILDKEETLWTSALTNEKKEPYLRISDINPIVTQEIDRATGGKLSFSNVRKDDKNAAINNLRVLISNKQIIINPKCKNLILHLKNCKWKKNSNKTEFARSEAFGHYDLVDCAIYFVRSINFNKNPYPAGYNLNLKASDKFVNNKNFGKSEYNNLVKTIFNRR